MTRKMTRDEAIECNKNLRMYMELSDKNQSCKFLEENYIALDMGIKALEQEPCDDAISRRAVEKITWEEPSYSDALNVLTEVRDKVRALPPVTPKPKTDVLDKIEPICDRINSLASVLPYTAHREIQELLCDIMALFKAESEDKE